MAWFLYLLECSDGSIYTGIATDVQARFDKHASGEGARYTRSRKPVRVLASFELADRSKASTAEYWVKRLTAVDKRALAAGLRTLESVLPAPEVIEVAEVDEAAEPVDALAPVEATVLVEAPAPVKTRKRVKALGVC
ncbi:putative endonuclease [Paraburkholderia sp. GAS333]|uniref:GIY-YIG nuclease family protein n=1 Tax=Paraburkholderia sp. GAS333 TaxID=3156279 RepID=UPI003D22E62A